MQLLLVVLAIFAISVSAYPSHQLRGLATGVWSPPGPGDVRGPCPALNTLSNHGYLPRNGKGITVDTLKSAVVGVYGFSPELAGDLATKAVFLDGVNGKLDMDGLNKHNTIEHDASISRDDTYFGTGQGVNYTLIFGLIDLSKDGVLTQDDFGKWQGIRQRDSVRRNPDFTFGTTQQTVTAGEPAFFLGVFGTQTNGFFSVTVDRFWSVFGEEKLPEGWTKATVTVDAPFVGTLGHAIASKWQSA